MTPEQITLAFARLGSELDPKFNVTRFLQEVERRKAERDAPPPSRQAKEKRKPI